MTHVSIKNILMSAAAAAALFASVPAFAVDVPAAEALAKKSTRA